MIHKRLLALVLALLVMFTACAPKPSNQATASPAPSQTPAPTEVLSSKEQINAFDPAKNIVGLIIDKQSEFSSRIAQHGFLRTAENLGYPAMLFAAEDSASAAARVDEAIAAGVKGLLIWADSAEMIAAVSKASAAGIKTVVPFYHLPASASIGSNLAMDYNDITSEAVRIIIAEIVSRNYKSGKMIMIRDAQTDYSLYSSFSSKFGTTYPEFEIVNWTMGATVEESLAAAAVYLKENADVAGVLSFVPGAADVWAKAKKQVETELKPKTTPRPTPKPKATPKPSGTPAPTPLPTPKPLDPTKRYITIIALGYSEENIKLVKDGVIFAFIAMPYFDSTAQSMMMLDRLMRGISAPAEVRLDAPLIRKSGVAKYESIVTEVKSWFGI